MSRPKESLLRRFFQTALIVVLLPILLPLFVIGFSLYLSHRAVLYMLVWILWLPKGKDTLVVYSDSPKWRDYMTQQVLPLVQERAVVLNWSERNKWQKWSFAPHVFRSFGGGHAFNPMVVLFRPFRRAKVFRFWTAFKDWKHGNREPVEHLRSELEMSLSSI